MGKREHYLKWTSGEADYYKWEREHFIGLTPGNSAYYKLSIDIERAEIVISPFPNSFAYRL